MRVNFARRAILAFAIVNAALFTALLPLWEGFDEAFHYGYVEDLWQSRKLPVLARTLVPYDVVASFPLAPVSNISRRAIPEGTAYDAWFALPAGERERRRLALEQLAPDPRPVLRGNYEAHQPPLAYLLLAPVDWSLRKLPLTVRVLVLRLFCGVGSAVLLFFGASALCRLLEVPESFATAALFGIFCSEMLYATTAHVANDWLAVGASVFLLVELVKLVRAPGRRTALAAGAWLTAGLLAKSYFLVFAAFAVGLAAVLVARGRTRIATLLPGAALAIVVAGPWYVRNIVLYGNAGGTPEAFEGVGIRQILAAAPRVDWPATAAFLARASLWTGNNTFNTYSRATLNVLLAGLALAMAAWFWRRRAIRSAEWTVMAASALFLAGVAYEGCAMVANHPGQLVPGPNPWYTQVLLAPLMALAYLGLSGWKRAGRVLAGAIVTLWAWILVATWMLKLFPMYASGLSSSMRARDAWNWWTHDTAAHARNLSETALAPAGWLYAALALALALTAAVWGLVMRALAKGELPVAKAQ
jgi:hypothetical protein